MLSYSAFSHISRACWRCGGWPQAPNKKTIPSSMYANLFIFHTLISQGKGKTIPRNRHKKNVDKTSDKPRTNIWKATDYKIPMWTFHFSTPFLCPSEADSPLPQGENDVFRSSCPSLPKRHTPPHGSQTYKAPHPKPIAPSSIPETTMLFRRSTMVFLYSTVMFCRSTLMFQEYSGSQHGLWRELSGFVYSTYYYIKEKRPKIKKEKQRTFKMNHYLCPNTLKRIKTTFN